MRARLVSQRMPVTGVFPTIARNLEGSSDAARGKDDRFRMKKSEPAFLTVIAEAAGDACFILQEGRNRALHVHLDAPVDAVILKRADHLQACAISNVREARIFVSPEIALQNSSILRAVEERAPSFQLANAIRGFLCVELCHPPVVKILPAAHGVGKVHLPIISLI